MPSPKDFPPLGGFPSLGGDGDGKEPASSNTPALSWAKLTSNKTVMAAASLAEQGAFNPAPEISATTASGSLRARRNKQKEIEGLGSLATSPPDITVGPRVANPITTPGSAPPLVGEKKKKEKEKEKSKDEENGNGSRAARTPMSEPPTPLSVRERRRKRGCRGGRSKNRNNTDETGSIASSATDSTWRTEEESWLDENEQSWSPTTDKCTNDVGFDKEEEQRVAEEGKPHEEPEDLAEGKKKPPGDRTPGTRTPDTRTPGTGTPPVSEEGDWPDMSTMPAHAVSASSSPAPRKYVVPAHRDAGPSSAGGSSAGGSSGGGSSGGGRGASSSAQSKPPRPNISWAVAAASRGDGGSAACSMTFPPPRGGFRSATATGDDHQLPDHRDSDESIDMEKIKRLLAMSPRASWADVADGEESTWKYPTDSQDADNDKLQAGHVPTPSSPLAQPMPTPSEERASSKEQDAKRDLSQAVEEAAECLKVATTRAGLLVDELKASGGIAPQNTPVGGTVRSQKPPATKVDEATSTDMIDTGEKQESGTKISKKKLLSRRVSSAVSIENLEEAIPLKSKWTFYQYTHGSSQMGIAKEMSSFSTAQGLWECYNQLAATSTLNYRSAVHLMRDDYPPKWNDPKCMEGGMWFVKVRSEDVDSAWENLVLAAVGEQLGGGIADDDDLIGISVSAREQHFNLQVWNKNAKANTFRLMSRVTRACRVELGEPNYKENANRKQPSSKKVSPSPVGSVGSAGHRSGPPSQGSAGSPQYANQHMPMMMMPGQMPPGMQLPPMMLPNGMMMQGQAPTSQAMMMPGQHGNSPMVMISNPNANNAPGSAPAGGQMMMMMPGDGSGQPVMMMMAPQQGMPPPAMPGMPQMAPLPPQHQQQRH